MKTVYFRYMSNDAEETIAQLLRVQDENAKLTRQINQNKSEMIELAQKLKTEKAKSTRLTKKIGTLSGKLKDVENYETTSKVRRRKNQMICVDDLLRLNFIIFLQTPDKLLGRTVTKQLRYVYEIRHSNFNL